MNNEETGKKITWTNAGKYECVPFLQLQLNVLSHSGHDVLFQAKWTNLAKKKIKDSSLTFSTNPADELSEDRLLKQLSKEMCRKEREKKYLQQAEIAEESSNILN